MPSSRRVCHLAALVLLACSSPPRHPITDPAMALAAVRARDARVRSIRARGSADHFGVQGRIRGTVYIFVERPARVRVDTAAFGNTVSTLISNGETFTLEDRRNNSFFMGPARPCVAAQLLGIPLESAEVVAVMAGGPPLLAGNARIRWASGHYVVDITGAGGRAETLEMEITDEEHDHALPERQSPRTTRAVLRDARGVRAVLSFENYTTVSGVAFPRRVRVVMERDNVDLLVRYDEVEIDPELPDNAWDQTPPEGMELVPVECEPAAAGDAGTAPGAATPGDAGAPTGG